MFVRERIKLTSIVISSEVEQVKSLQLKFGDLVPGDMLIIEQASAGWYEHPLEYLVLSITTLYDDMIEIRVMQTGSFSLGSFTARAHTHVYAYPRIVEDSS
jgi:hypothetical protein